MKKFLIYSLFAVAGTSLGSLITWINSHSNVESFEESTILLESVLAHSNTKITEDNYACEGKPVKTVGAVFASIIELNNLYKRNMLSYGCINRTCALSVSSCKPWQDQECGNRILKFDLNEKNEIETNTFTCIDMP